MSLKYIAASKALGAIRKGKSLSQYCAKNKLGKVEFALCCETLKYGSVIRNILNICAVDASKIGVDEFLLDIMVYELLFGCKKITGGGSVKRELMKYSNLLSDFWNIF